MKMAKANWISKPKSSLYYTSTAPSFSWAKLNEGIYKQQGGWHTCRETFSEDLTDWIKQSRKSKLSPRSTTMFMIYRTEHGEKLKRKKGEYQKLVDSWAKVSLKLVHAVEKKLGWALSRAKRLPAEDTSTYVAGHVFTGSLKWKASPQLLSLYMLLLRAGTFKEMSEVGNYEELLEAMRAIRSEVNNHEAKMKAYRDEKGKHPGKRPYNARQWADAKHMLRLLPNMDLLLDNFDKLFFSQPVIDNYKVAAGHHGINGMIGGSGGAPPRIRKLWKEIKKATKQKGGK